MVKNVKTKEEGWVEDSKGNEVWTTVRY